MKIRSTIGECLAMFFCWNSESRSGVGSGMGFVGGGLASPPKHATGAKAPAKTAAQDTPEAVSIAVGALAGHLPRYQRSMANYARALIEPDEDH